MRFHVLGLGSIGTFVAHNLRQSLSLRSRGIAWPSAAALAKNPWSPYLIPDPASASVTLQLRSQAKANNFKGTVVEHAGIRNREPPAGFSLEAAGIGTVNSNVGGLDDSSSGFSTTPSIVQQLGFTSRQDAIDSLIVTTKADRTVSAIRPLAARLTPASTVVLLQNGMGVMDELVTQIWPDEQQRPRLVLGNVTHGCWAKNAFDIVHAGVGSIFLGLPPATLGSTTAQVQTQAQAHADSDGEAMPAVASLDPSTDVIVPEPAAMAASPLHLSLLYTLSAFLTNPVLDGRLETTYQSYLIRALQKLVVNACINPLTTILDCRNGELLGDSWVDDIWSDVVHEASDVFLAMATNGAASAPLRKSDQGSVGKIRTSMGDWSHLIQRPLGNSGDATARATLDASLTPPALLQTVRAVARATSMNYSSMHRDVRFPRKGPLKGKKPYGGKVRDMVDPRKSTEMAYLNGWLSSRGRELGVRTDVNDTLVRLVGSLTASSGQRGSGFE